jgi:hypothetical protein
LWIEVARNPKLATAHPRWMAALGSHEDWQKNFPKFPEPGVAEVAKAFPWVPISYREAFDAHWAVWTDPLAGRQTDHLWLVEEQVPRTSLARIHRELSDGLSEQFRDVTPAHVISRLKRDESTALNSTLLHELYFASLGGDGRVLPDLAIDSSRNSEVGTTTSLLIAQLDLWMKRPNAAGRRRGSTRGIFTRG